jgi:hypothetical protein
MSGRRKSKKNLQRSEASSARMGRRSTDPVGESGAAASGEVPTAPSGSGNGNVELYSAGPGSADPGERQLGRRNGDATDSGWSGATASNSQENGHVEQSGNNRPGRIRDDRRVVNNLADTEKRSTGDDVRRDELASDISTGQRDRPLRLLKAEWFDVPHYWPKVEHWLAAAVAHNAIAWIASDVRHELMFRRMQLWLALDGDAPVACAVTRIDDGPRARICNVLLIGGVHIDEWLIFEEDMCRWARSIGAVALEGPGRRGWERKVKSRGWRPVWTIYRKLLQD